jgi:predicted HD phosphohydrolase
MSKPLLSGLTADNLVDRLEALSAVIVRESYLGEDVTIGDHMLQCAALAQAEGAPDALVAAALLHDVGYYLDAAPDNENETQPARRHDAAAGRALAALLPEAAVEPVRLHVDAKRYLCAVEPDYRARLSPASIHTMSLQGGIMDGQAAAAFAALPHAEDACRLRRWDDAGKVRGADVPGFAAYRPLLERLVALAQQGG